MTCAAVDESVSSLVALNADGWGLELTFWIRVDRCAHRLAAIDGSRRVVLLESIEGAADDLWPPSPPWQQVQAPFAGHRCPENQSSANHSISSTMLVGAAGASHWSASVERIGGEGIGSNESQTEENQNLPSTGWLFDVACRAKQSPKRLISTYRIVDPRQLVSPGQIVTSASESSGWRSQLELLTDIGRYQLCGLPLAPNQPDSCQLCLSEGKVHLYALPQLVSPNPVPTTFRWRYQIRTMMQKESVANMRNARHGSEVGHVRSGKSG